MDIILTNEYVTMNPSWIALIHLYIKVALKYKFNILIHTRQKCLEPPWPVWPRWLKRHPITEGLWV